MAMDTSSSTTSIFLLGQMKLDLGEGEDRLSRQGPLQFVHEGSDIGVGRQEKVSRAA